MKKLYISLLFTLFMIGYQTAKAQEYNYVQFEVFYPQECGPVNVQFSNYSSLIDTIGPVHFEWYLNGKLFSTTPYPSDTLLSGGNYNVNLWVWDEGGWFSGDYYQDIYIPGFPKISYYPNEVCPTEPVSFHVEGQIDWVLWKYPDGSTSVDGEGIYVFNDPGNYTVKAIGATWECGLDSASVNVLVDAAASPRAEIWLNGNFFCPNDEIKFSSPEAAHHEWVIGLDTLLGQEIYYAFGDTGQYEVFLTTMNGCGQTTTVSEMIYIGYESYANAWFEIDYGPNPQCPNYEYKFEAQAGGQYEWDFGDGSYAYDRIAYNTYSDTGTYTVRLITRNGCGYTDTIYQDVFVEYFTENIPYVEINFKNKDSFIDTLHVCPGTKVEIESHGMNGDNDAEYTWYVEGLEFHSQNLIYNFSTIDTTEVKLVAINKCGGTDTAYKYVAVNPLIPPINMQFGVAPLEICPGEEVYFWNDAAKNGGEWNENFLQSIKHEIDFGDGNVMPNITDPTVDFPPVLAAHRYDIEGTYPFIFTAQNTCGVTESFEGNIIVSNDASRLPFYYVGSSTIDDDGNEGEMEDWSTYVPNSHEFVVPINLWNWNYIWQMTDTVYIYMWYGQIDPNSEEDPGMPDGVVQVVGSDTVSVFVPYNVINPSVGIAVVWYCDPLNADMEPQLYALPLNMSMEMINSFPLQKNGLTDLRTEPDIYGPLTLDGMMWTDGPCTAPLSQIRNRWIYQADDEYWVSLGIWEEDGGMMKYNINYGPDRWDTRSFVSSGDIMQTAQDSLYFMQMDGQMCPAPDFKYSYLINAQEELVLTNYSDICTNRINLLTAKPFFKDDDNWNYDYERDRTGCPGDTFELYVAGGISYEWHLTDGTVSTQNHFYHAYPDTGKYKELLIATNSCGRIDSIYTTVIIDTTNVPEAFWYTNNWEVRRMEPIQFWYEEHGDDDFNNNTYLWEFGDGKISTLKAPTHYYTYEGEYNVTLTVENGCGSTSQTQSIWVRKELASCVAKFTFEKIGNTVSFRNNSIGDISSYFWDFGDGKVSQKFEPTHTYVNAGIYEVTLIVHDSITDCSDQISVMLSLGDIDCFANFTYQVNETNKNVVFKDASEGDVNSWYWEFGDGTFSTDTLPVHNYVNNGIYPVCLTIINDATGCMSTICKEITVGEVEIYANFNHFIEPGTSTVNYSDNSDGNITNWYWEFGDGMWDTIPNTTHTYAESGEYNVCLSAYNMFTGSFDDICKDIVVISDTSAVITKAKFTYIANPLNNTVKFIDVSTGNITHRYWTFGDGTYTSGDTVVHQYPTQGIFNVCLTVYDESSNERSEICKPIQVGLLACNVNAEFGYYINPTTNQVTFSDKSTGTANAWFWDFGDRTTSSQKNPKHVYTEPGFYLVSLGIRDTVNDCNDYYADFIQVGSAECVADFKFTVTDVDNNIVKFEDNSNGNPTDFFWYFDDGTYSTEQNPNHTYQEAGLYFVSLTTTNASGCFDYRIKNVQVGTVDCDASFTVYVDSTNNKAYFTNSSIGSATSYYWLFGDGSYHVGANPVHQYVAPGFFNVSLNTFNENNGCIDFHEDVLLIGNSDNDVEADFYYKADFSTGTVNFYNESLGDNLTYLWYFGDDLGSTSTQENPTFIFTDGGYYFVCLTATNSSTGDSKTTCKMVLTSDSEAENCLADFNYDMDISTREVLFKDKSVGNPDIYEWDFGDGNTETSAEPTHTYSENGYYFVTMYTKNSTTGCESYDYDVLNVGAGDNGIQAFFTYVIDTTTTTKAGGKPVDIIGIGHGGGSRLSWTFGDATQKSANEVTTSTLRPTHEYAAPGKYEVCLTIEDPVISQSDTYCDTVEIKDESQTGIDDLIENKLNNINVYPNPMQSYTRINYTLVNTSQINITLFDASGNQIETLVNTFKPAGDHQIIWRDSGLSSGIYYLIFRTENEVITEKLIIQK